MNHINHPIPHSNEFNALVDEVVHLRTLIAWLSILMVVLCGLALGLFVAAAL